MLKKASIVASVLVFCFGCAGDSATEPQAQTTLTRATHSALVSDGRDASVPVSGTFSRSYGSTRLDVQMANGRMVGYEVFDTRSGAALARFDGTLHVRIAGTAGVWKDIDMSTLRPIVERKIQTLCAGDLTCIAKTNSQYPQGLSSGSLAQTISMRSSVRADTCSESGFKLTRDATSRAMAAPTEDDGGPCTTLFWEWTALIAAAGSASGACLAGLPATLLFECEVAAGALAAENQAKRAYYTCKCNNGSSFYCDLLGNDPEPEPT
jgi:hypothetical protein